MVAVDPLRQLHAVFLLKHLLCSLLDHIQQALIKCFCETFGTEMDLTYADMGLAV